MQPFTIDLAGRLSNLDLRPAKVLNPLFEAISNSLHAIDDAGGRGKISIEIIRAPGGNLADDAVDGFIVRDDGVGFTPGNFSSFLRSDSTYKQSRGGKGVGRLLWLKAFRSVEIVSVFRDAERTWRRQFTFALPDGVQGGEPQEWNPDAGTETEVILRGFLPSFREVCPVSSQTVANKIVEHFALVFLGQPPHIELIDRGDRISLLQTRDALFAPAGPETPISVGQYESETSGRAGGLNS